MKCEVCGKNEATVHLTEVINGNVTKLHICEHCAKEKSEEMQSHFGLSDLLAGLVDLGPDMPEAPFEPGREVELHCPLCGMSYYDLQRSGKFGCGGCYKVFEPYLSDLLRRIHGGDRHVGKMPFRGKDMLREQEDLRRLRSELSKQVSAEEFEKAALTRDRIRELEEKLSNGGVQ